MSAPFATQQSGLAGANKLSGSGSCASCGQSGCAGCGPGDKKMAQFTSSTFVSTPGVGAPLASSSSSSSSSGPMLNQAQSSIDKTSIYKRRPNGSFGMPGRQRYDEMSTTDKIKSTMSHLGRVAETKTAHAMHSVSTAMHNVGQNMSPAMHQVGAAMHTMAQKVQTAVTHVHDKIASATNEKEWGATQQQQQLPVGKTDAPLAASNIDKTNILSGQGGGSLLSGNVHKTDALPAGDIGSSLRTDVPILQEPKPILQQTTTTSTIRQTQI